MKLSIEDFEKLKLEAEFRADESLADHTTFKVGGPARVFALPQNIPALEQIIAVCKDAGEKWVILGRGSNTLASDKGFDGVVICLADNFTRTTVTAEGFDALAGTSIIALAAVARRVSLTGLEFASGIPGTLGGAIAMNAGAYGGEMKDVVESVTVLDEDGTLLTFAGEDMNFRYRGSRVFDENLIVVSAKLKLQKGDKLAIGKRMNELLIERRVKQPLDLPSAGSTFKRPEGHFAGALIEQAGLAGFTVGGAKVSEKHCGFMVNAGDATASDVWNLCKEVQRIVRERSGVSLEMEVKLLGDFD